MLKRFLKSEDGNFSIIFAATLGCLSMGVATAVELARINNVDSALQASLDIATLHAATIKKEQTFSDDGIATFEENFRSRNMTSGSNINFAIVGDDVVGKASVDMPLVIGGLIGRRSIRLSAKTVIKTQSSQSSPCIIALSKTASPGVNMNGGAHITAPDCSMEIHSMRRSALVINGGTTLDMAKICVASNHIRNNTRRPVKNLEKGCAVPPDRYAGAYPVPSSTSCQFNHGNYNKSEETMKPGVYCGWHNFNNSNAKVTFEPGTYVIKNGGWNVNGGEWNGDGVTFYFADRSKIQFNSGVKATMSAPTTGDYTGVFMTENPNLPRNNSQFILNDSRGFDFEGLLYLPSRQINFNSGSSLRSHTMKLVANSFVFNSANIELNASFDDSDAVSDVFYMSE